jgi:hypothetical protein
MSTFDADRATRKGLGLALVGTPVAWLASAVICPPLKSDAARQLAVVRAHPDRWYWFTVLLLVGGLALVPALLGVMRLLRERSPKLAVVGGWLAVFGALVAIGDVATQFWTWLMVRSGQDPVQMARLLDGADRSSAANVAYAIGGPALLLGTLLLCIGLFRTRIVARWVPVTFFAGCVLNIVAFSNAATAGVTTSYVVLLFPMAALARVVVRDGALTTPAYAARPVSTPAHRVA